MGSAISCVMQIFVIGLPVSTGSSCVQLAKCTRRSLSAVWVAACM